MNKELFAYLESYSSDALSIDRLIVSAFLKSNKLQPKVNLFLKGYIIDSENPAELKTLDDFLSLVIDKKRILSIEDLIELFEFVISPADKEINGAVYTPKIVREYIVRQTIEKLEKTDFELPNTTFGDIACGCGGFFYTIAVILHKKTGKSFYEIYRDNLFGLDIEEYSIIRTKILLSILALCHNEDPDEFEFNLSVGDALSYNFKSECLKIENGLDVVVGNPPYVGAVKLDEETKEKLKKWSVTKTGKADLYIPFFQIGLELLMDKGIFYLLYTSFQTSRPGLNLVLQLNFDAEHNREYHRLVNPDKEDHPFIFGGHPTSAKRSYTLAWARLDISLDTGEVLIEEIQNDWLREAMAWVKKAQYLLEQERDTSTHWVLGRTSFGALKEYVEKTTTSYAKLWDEAVLCLAVQFCKKELGVDHIYYHTFEGGNYLKGLEYGQPPKSLYTKLPRRFGFTETGEAPRLLKEERYLKKKLRKQNLKWFQLLV